MGAWVDGWVGGWAEAFNVNSNHARPPTNPHPTRSHTRNTTLNPSQCARTRTADEGALGVSGGLSLMAHALVDIAQQMGARVEPFALGPVSAQLGAWVGGGCVDGGAAGL